MEDLAHFEIPLDTDNYATNAYIPAMKDFFSEVNNDDWFSTINGYNYFCGNFALSDKIKVTGKSCGRDELNRGIHYEDFELKEKSFRMSTYSKIGVGAAVVAANVAIPGMVVETSVAAIAGALGGIRKLEVKEIGYESYVKVPLASYETRLDTIMDKLIKMGATEKTSDGYDVVKDITMRNDALNEIRFAPKDGNARVCLEATDDHINVSITSYGVATKTDTALFKAVLGYADSNNIDINFTSNAMKEFYEGHKYGKGWLGSTVDKVKDWFKK